MITDERLHMFKPELGTIKSQVYRDFAEAAIISLPDYFFEIPALSTGKYHPSYALGTGGLVRHTKAAVLFCNLLLDLEQNKKKFTEREQDLIRIALLLHDGFKLGNTGGKYTVFDHPLICAKWVLTNPDFREYITKDDAEFLYLAISSHMGEWNVNPKFSEDVLPKPETKYQEFVHMCDYLASRKMLEIPFDTETNEIGKSAPKEHTEKAETNPLDYVVSFGKYKGNTIRDILEMPQGESYLKWCAEEADRINPSVKSKIRQALEIA